MRRGLYITLGDPDLPTSSRSLGKVPVGKNVPPKPRRPRAMDGIKEQRALKGKEVVGRWKPIEGFARVETLGDILGSTGGLVERLILYHIIISFFDLQG